MPLSPIANGASSATARASINAAISQINALTSVYDIGSTGTSPVAINAANGLVQKVAITNNVTISAPTNPVTGMELSLAIAASGGARTITLGSITVPTTYTFSGVIASGSVRRLRMYYTGSAWLLTSNLEFA